MAISRKDIEVKNNDNLGGILGGLSEKEILEILEENKRLKNKSSDVKDGVLWGYEIVLTKLNNRYIHQKSIDFGENGKIYNVVFGEPCEIPASVVENLRNHIKSNTYIRDGKTDISQIHYQFSISREIYK